MRYIGPILRWLRIGRLLDWWRFTYLRLRSPGTITAVDLPRIDPRVTVRVARQARLVLGRNVTLRSGVSLYVDASGVLEIGDDSALNSSCWVGVTSRISIGRSCLIGPMVTIVDGNHAFDLPGQRIWDQGLATREIIIGDDVWIGSKATVINSIGEGAVVGANAVVAKPIPAWAVAVGVPAVVQRYRPSAESSREAAPISGRPDAEVGDA